MKLKAVHKIDQGNFDADESEVEAHNTFVMEEEGSSQDNDEENESESDHEENEEEVAMEESTEADDNDVFLMNYCDFLNRLSNFHFVPWSTSVVSLITVLQKYIIHSGYLVSVPECQDLLTLLYALLETRTQHYNQVLQLRGKLEQTMDRQGDMYGGGHRETGTQSLSR